MKEQIKSYIQKYRARKQAEIRREFLTEALEITEKPVSPLGHFVIFVTAVIVLFFITWSVFGKMDEVVTARGRIITISGVQNVQAFSSGLVEQICVKEGERVAAGQTMVLIDSSVNRITLQNTEQSLELLELENELLEEILENKDISPRLSGETNKERTEIIHYVLAIEKGFQTQKEEADSTIEQALSQIAIEEAALEKLRENMNYLTEQRKTLDSMQEYSNTEELSGERMELTIQYKEEQLADYRELYQAGAVPEIEVKAMELELEQLKKDYEIQKSRMIYEDYDNNLRRVELDNQIVLAGKDISSQENAVLLAKQGHGQAVESLNTLKADFEARVSGLIVENKDKISNHRSDFEIQTINMDQQTIVSPVDGIVKTLEINTVGGVLISSQTVAAVVPDDSQMIVEIDILNRDIGYVQIGQEVVMKLDTFHFQKYGKLEGRIVSISPDAIMDERKGWVYKAKAVIDEEAFQERNPQAEIGIGMECTTEIKIGERRILDFFLEPVMEHFDGSLKVR